MGSLPIISSVTQGLTTCCKITRAPDTETWRALWRQLTALLWVLASWDSLFLALWLSEGERYGKYNTVYMS